MPTVEYDELESAVIFVSGDPLLSPSVRISRETGVLYWLDDESLEEEPVPDDIDDDERYVEVPSQRDLGLGKRLALEFVAEKLPEALDRAYAIFRRQGAYSRFKALLESHGRLDEWYEYERSALRSALSDWAREEGFELMGIPNDPAAP